MKDSDIATAKKFVQDVIVFIAVVGSALMMWNVAKIVTNTESPIVVVLTGSMEPAFYRGDLLLVTHFKEDLRMGDIIVYKIPNQDIPIVHRAMVMQIHQSQKGEQTLKLQLLDHVNDYLVSQPYNEEFSMLSKGDANPVDDRGLYPPKTFWLNRKHVIGKIRAYCPYVGYLTILLNENPILKYTVLGLMLFSVMIAKDPENK